MNRNGVCQTFRKKHSNRHRYMTPDYQDFKTNTTKEVYNIPHLKWHFVHPKSFATDYLNNHR